MVVLSPPLYRLIILCCARLGLVVTGRIPSFYQVIFFCTTGFFVCTTLVHTYVRSALSANTRHFMMGVKSLAKVASLPDIDRLEISLGDFLGKNVVAGLFLKCGAYIVNPIAICFARLPMPVNCPFSQFCPPFFQPALLGGDRPIHPLDFLILRF